VATESRRAASAAGGACGSAARRAHGLGSAARRSAGRPGAARLGTSPRRRAACRAGAHDLGSASRLRSSTPAILGATGIRPGASPGMGTLQRPAAGPSGSRGLDRAAAGFRAVAAGTGLAGAQGGPATRTGARRTGGQLWLDVRACSRVSPRPSQLGGAPTGAGGGSRGAAASARQARGASRARRRSHGSRLACSPSLGGAAGE
jgi:hypothetical protein